MPYDHQRLKLIAEECDLTRMGLNRLTTKDDPELSEALEAGLADEVLAVFSSIAALKAKALTIQENLP